MFKTITTIFMILLWSSFYSFGQEHTPEGQEGHVPMVRGAIMMANSHVPNALYGEKNVAIIPTWGVDLDYFFHRRWSLAFQGDIKLQSFEVEDEGLLLERTNPVSGTLVIHYHARRHWSFYAGPGYEFERSENLGLFRLGTEYSFEVTEDFEIALNLAFEDKRAIYKTWTFGIAFNKKIWEKNK